MKHSSCCGALIPLDFEDMQRCPDCKESCGFAEDEESIELITVVLDKDLFEDIKHSHSMVTAEELKANTDYTIKSVEIKDGFFDLDSKHKELKKLSNKAYKDLKNYEWEARNK